MENTIRVISCECEEFVAIATSVSFTVFYTKKKKTVNVKLVGIARKRSNTLSIHKK